MGEGTDHAWDSRTGNGNEDAVSVGEAEAER